ncbi:histone acetyltransferase 1 [Friedmanniomyces endolithicus]|uniref:Histone acetyltransferase type B catalytic subunit n=1 Tax=Friedmanniomyces endolithicus TaxID=329885 RepID=A0AAN6JIE5_9PEZI|nr:histone acetyltransferase 1 [Friedmanniomyces endolithicus]KAK0294288.1 histone acetyltransferase 1 [Friedmanniomyces endolithicus]KAK0325508.1 histone acetyltransferase 1 [Friedmanniomyces endolithicus]KAK1003250.1 histone acetyltransferase 1 [Friedmanniomyces endolithicus]
MATESDDEQTEVLKQQVENWSTNTNECFTIQLLKGETVTASFQPSFTYPIFGEEERVFGYKELSITLSFAAHDLQPRLEIKHGKLFSEGDVKPTNIKEALAEFLPAHAFSDASRDKGSEDAAAASFKPPGGRIEGYMTKSRRYEIWCASLTHTAARQILENMEILIPMFIEGGTMLQLGQDWSTQRWKLFLLYEVDRKPTPNTSPYSLVGYGTSYRVFTFPDRTSVTEGDQDLSILNGESLETLFPPTDQTSSNHSSKPGSPLDLPSRERLSQFLILPPFQGEGHGQHLYNTMYAHLTSPTNIREFTVEDPNEAFDDLRDLCDLLYLRANVPEFAALRINTDPAVLTPEKLLPGALIPTDLLVDGAARERIRRTTKIERRQFNRLVEMHTLSFIPASHRSRSRLTRKEKSSNADDRAYWFWRLYAKQRLYVHNRDELVQLERAERGVRLEAVLDGVLEGYAGLLERVEGREGAKGMEVEETEEEEEVVEGATKPTQRKRKKIVVDEDEDEDGEEDGMVGVEVVANGHKRPRAN